MTNRGQQAEKLTKNCNAADILREKIEDSTVSTTADCDDVRNMDDEFLQHPEDHLAIFFTKRAREYEGMLKFCLYFLFNGQIS